MKSTSTETIHNVGNPSLYALQHGLAPWKSYVIEHTWHAFRHVANVARHVYEDHFVCASDIEALPVAIIKRLYGTIQCILSFDVVQGNVLERARILVVLHVVGGKGCCKMQNARAGYRACQLGLSISVAMTTRKSVDHDFRRQPICDTNGSPLARDLSYDVTSTCIAWI